MQHAEKVENNKNNQNTILDRVNIPTDIKSLDDTEIKELANNVRNHMIGSVAQTGGHLGAGLGVVELTTAIHAVFDTPKDKLIWDVGHQCYPHKILTGRKGGMTTIRKGGGLSGFTKRKESEYDDFWRRGTARPQYPLAWAWPFHVIYKGMTTMLSR